MFRFRDNAKDITRYLDLDTNSVRFEDEVYIIFLNVSHYELCFRANK